MGIIMSKSSENKSRKLSPNHLVTLSLIAYGAFIIIILMTAFNDESQIVPLLNLRQAYHIMLFTLGWPIVGCLLAIFVVPRLIIPLYLKFKRKVSHRAFTDSRIDLERPITAKLLLSRAFNVFLLVMGLESVLIPILDLSLFLLPDQISVTDGLPEAIRAYNPQVFLVTAGMIFPVAMMLWVIVWVIQDSGLIHYTLAEDPTKYQEIEPVYFNIAGNVKGFAGISSLFFYFTAIYHLSQYITEYWFDLIWIGSAVFLIMIWSAPFLMLYFSRKYSWVTKDVEKMARIKMEDLKFH